MTIAINLNYDDPDDEFYACNCGIISKLAEALQDHVDDDDTLTSLEIIENEYWNEADRFEYWSDCVEVDPSGMEKDEIKNRMLAILPEVTPIMSNDEEMRLIEQI